MVVNSNGTYKNYCRLQCALFLVHWGVAFAVLGMAASNDCEAFKTAFNFRYNVWKYNGDDQTCEDGCTLSRETYEFKEKLNVNFLVSFFSIVSGTNHLIQTYWSFKESRFNYYLGHGYLWIRFVDFGVSAGLMVVANSILFYVPPDVTTMTLWFLFQCLTQLGGYSAEVLLHRGAPKDAMNVFFVSGILYLVPWSLLFATFAMTTQQDMLNNREINTPPIQVWFFIGWIFQTFMLFPLATYFKIESGKDSEALGYKFAYKYELINSLLSFIAKLPLLSVFAGGSFQRGLFTNLEDDTEQVDPSVTVDADGCPIQSEGASGFDGNTYFVLFFPMAMSFLGAFAVVYLFRTDLGVDLGKTGLDLGKIAEIGGICFGALLVLTSVVLLPALISLSPDVTDPTAILYTSLAVPPAILTGVWIWYAGLYKTDTVVKF